MGRIIKDIFILFAITLVAGLALGFVFNITKEPRKIQEQKTINKAYAKVMPGVKNTKEVKLPSDLKTKITKKIKADEKANNVTPINEFNADISYVVKATNDKGEEIGHIVTVTDNEAYGGSLTMTVGIDSEKKILGVSFLSLAETPGLGMNADNDSFKKQFKNKQVPYFVYTKTGAKADNEIDAISSATVTTNAVTHGVNAAIACVNFLEGGEGNE